MPQVPLPDEFEINQAAVMGAEIDRAFETGDIQPALNVMSHIGAESGLTGDELEKLKDGLLAAFLFGLCTKLREHGDHDQAKFFWSMMVNLCSAEAQRAAATGALFKTGVNQGWLPAREHDIVADSLVRMAAGPDMQAVRDAFANVRRVETPTADTSTDTGPAQPGQAD